MGYRINTFTIEQPQGAGRVLKGADWIADATYNLAVTQAVKTYATLGGNVVRSRLADVSAADAATRALQSFPHRKRSRRRSPCCP